MHNQLLLTLTVGKLTQQSLTFPLSLMYRLRLLPLLINGQDDTAAHQFLVEREGADYKQVSRDDMEQLGKAIFYHYFNNYNPSFR